MLNAKWQNIKVKVHLKRRSNLNNFNFIFNWIFFFNFTMTVSKGLTGQIFVTPSWPEPLRKTLISEEEILTRNAEWGIPPSRDGHDGCQNWRTKIYTGKYMLMGWWPVNHKESPGIQSQSPQHARTDSSPSVFLLSCSHPQDGVSRWDRRTSSTAGVSSYSSAPSPPWPPSSPSAPCPRAPASIWRLARR